MTITNSVVANALVSAGATTNARGDDAEIFAAYREGCRKICGRMLEDIKRLKAFVAGQEGMHNKQSDTFREYVRGVLDAELSLRGVVGSR